VVVAESAYYPGLFLQGPRKTTKDLSKDSFVPVEFINIQVPNKFPCRYRYVKPLSTSSDLLAIFLLKAKLF
jgi:hypothetical protein